MLIVIRRNNNAFVYINSCPHIVEPLDLQPGKFLSHNKISFAQPTVRCLKFILAIVFLAPAKTIILTFFRFRLKTAKSCILAKLVPLIFLFNLCFRHLFLVNRSG